ncbi:MAG TPA: Yip1 family protein, partial [Blastocatellia bacterium]|nr:Yip1 family protein [Blastocatellia bacterium]
MSETKHEVETDTPAYAAAQAQQAPPEEPAKLNFIQRLVGVIFSPGPTFEDINRKPTWLAAVIIAMLLVIASTAFFNWYAKPDWDRIFRTQIRKQLEKSNQSMTPEQIEQRVEFSKKIVPFFPVIAAVSIPIVYVVVAGVLALGMMLIQAQTTFKKILSVVSWSYTGTTLVQAIVGNVALMVQDQETLNNLDPTQGVNIVPSNLGAFLPDGTSGPMMALATSIDVFS